MLKSFLDESLEVVWLASVVGGLSLLGVGLAIVLALLVEHLPTLAAHV